ncbi:hypothetical protein [Synechococcus sp. PCC 7336]|uniref:hypothetical protein n=1 Tax=Synechococcus sp. PCC 7336 TaxID=195250 RepID=UPI0003825C95|nr:hypothetical protein [Synechococcus sp. PCC 7336]
MSNNLLIFIGEGIQFDLESTVSAIKKIDGVTDLVEREGPGAIFECTYKKNGDSTILRLSKDLLDISIDRVDELSLSLVLSLQEVIDQPLSVVDTGYSFHINLEGIKSFQDLQSRIENFEFEE